MPVGMRASLRERASSSRGATVVEYGLIIAFVALAAIVGIQALTSAMQSRFIAAAGQPGMAACTAPGCAPPVINVNVPQAGALTVTPYGTVLGEVGVPLMRTVTVSGGSGLYEFIPDSPLPGDLDPEGLRIDRTTGKLSGTPGIGTEGTHTRIITVRDTASNATATSSLTLTIAPKSTNVLKFATGYTAITATVGTAITPQNPGLTGGTPTYSVSIAPSTPWAATGLSFDTSTGTISGTPTAASGPITFTVTAKDFNGTSISTTVAVTVLPKAVPGKPTITKADKGVGTITLTWTAPTTGGAVASYEIQLNASPAPADPAAWAQSIPVSDAAAVYYTVTGLDKNVYYVFRIRAVNAEGPGGWSNVETQKPQ